jgi:hypothetical protein
MPARAPGFGAARRGFRWLALRCFLALLVVGEAGAQAPSSPASAPAPPSEESLDEAAAEVAFKRIDSNHDQQLSREEFMAALSNGRQGLVYQRLPAHFRDRDTDKSGFLEAGEFAALRMVVAAGDAAPTMASADSNGDARLDFREYAALMAKLDGALR